MVKESDFDFGYSQEHITRTLSILMSGAQSAGEGGRKKYRMVRRRTGWDAYAGEMISAGIT